MQDQGQVRLGPGVSLGGLLAREAAASGPHVQSPARGGAQAAGGTVFCRLNRNAALREDQVQNDVLENIRHLCSAFLTFKHN